MSVDLHTLARALGGEVGRWRGGVLVRVPGIGHSERDRSVSILFGADYPDGFWITCFGSGDPTAERGRVLALLDGSTIAEAATPAPSRGGRKPDKNALWTWAEARQPAGTRVEQYLAHRGLELPAFAGDSIRYHPEIWFDGERVPAMVALVSDIHSSVPLGIHRTALSWGAMNYDVHGKKRMAQGPISGGAVKLTPDEEVTTCLAIGEGIETTLSLQLTEYGRSPVWSLLNDSGVENFPVLSGVECLWIAVDHDPAGEKAAKACAKRWQRAGREVLLVKAHAAGSDLNDLVRAERRHA